MSKGNQRIQKTPYIYGVRAGSEDVVGDRILEKIDLQGGLNRDIYINR